LTDPDPLRWQVYPEIGDEFCRQMASEHKIIDPHTKQMVWKEKTSGAANHWWDCSAMSCAVASAMGAAMPKPKISERETRQSVAAPEWMKQQKKW
jgi:hypothetical protein